MMKRPLKSLYIHIPFCADKCYYCSFVSFSGKFKDADKYISALKKEIIQGLKANPDITLNSVYIGGGTPSILPVSYYQEILAEISKLERLSENTEITMEVNPGTVNLEYLTELRKIGINRLSIGIQSFDDDILKIINRQHTAKDAVIAVNQAKAAGFDNISIDLIYGLPEQTLSDFEKTLNQAVSIDIQHISTYGLKIEENTVFDKNSPPNLPDEELQAEMYQKTIKILTKSGFEHYEISNFCKTGRESRHNLAYWNNEEYFGFGLSAHGYLKGVRYGNLCNFDKYIENPLIKELSHSLVNQERIEEGIFLGLRLRQGINIEKFTHDYDVNIAEKYKKIIDKHIQNGFMKFKEGNIRLTNKGVLLSNMILSDFLG